MSKNLSAKYYREKKRKPTKKARERYQNLSKDKKGEREKMIVNATKISEKMKSRGLLSIEKIIIESKKMLYYD